LKLTFSLGRKTFLGAAFGSLAASLVLVITRFSMPNVSERFEAETLDSRYHYRIKHLSELRQGAPIEDIVIVDIDDRSLHQLGRYAQWPRSYHGRLVDYLRKEGATVIGFDILFMERDADPKADSAFVRSVRRAGNVVNAIAFSSANEDAFLYAMESPPKEFEAQRHALSMSKEMSSKFHRENRFDGKCFPLYNASARLGFANFLAEDDDTIRRMPLFLRFAGQTYPSLALAVVMQHTGFSSKDLRFSNGAVWLGKGGHDKKNLYLPIDAAGRMLVNYMGGFQTFRYVSYFDVLEQRLPEGFIAGKIVLVGASAAGLYDLRAAPFQGDFPGVEIHANLIHNLLSQDFILQPASASSLIMLWIMAIVIGVISLLLNPGISLFSTLGVAGGFVWLSFWSFTHHNVWMPMLEPLLAMGLSLLIVMVYRYVSEEREKKFIYGLFGNYLSDSLVREMLRHPSKLKLGGERKSATAFFSDIQNFTTYSEMYSPEALIKQLNEYLSAMTEVVLKYGGYLDKYVGDAIVAAFGIPVAQDDHALRACYAALDMQEQLVQLQIKWRSEKRAAFDARVGMNSGAMIAGNIGSNDRFDYTMIGDSVNLASRLEGANKTYGTKILISESTYELTKNRIIGRELDYIRVKGKKRPVRIYELVARRDRGLSQNLSACFTHYARGLGFYRDQEWKMAMAEFHRALELKKNDGPSLEFLRRCEAFMEAPNPRSWDGVYEMQTK